jgi:hypothetical protein
MKVLSDVLSHVGEKSFKVTALVSWHSVQNGYLANPIWESRLFYLLSHEIYPKSRYNLLAYIFGRFNPYVVIFYCIWCHLILCMYDWPLLGGKWIGWCSQVTVHWVGGWRSFIQFWRYTFMTADIKLHGRYACRIVKLYVTHKNGYNNQLSAILCTVQTRVICLNRPEFIVCCSRMYFNLL